MIKSNVKIVIGSHGSGKSNFLYETLLKESRKEDGRIDLNKKIYLVVPEQDTNDKQRLMMNKSAELGFGTGILNIDVISFDRMAHNVFDILNIEPLKENVIDDDIKTMILTYVLSTLGRANKLKFCGKMVGRVGFARKLTKAMSEFYAYDVTDKDIEEAIKNSDSDIYNDKLNDLKLIFTEFKATLNALGFSIKEDKYDLLNKRIKDVNIFNDSIIAFDGFTGFTPIQLEIFKKLSNVAKNIYVAVDMRNPREIVDLTSDDNIKKVDVFYLSKKFVKDIMKAVGVNTAKSLLCEDSIKDGTIKYGANSDDVGKKDLQYIENNLYNSNADKSKMPKIENIDYYVADNIRDEVKNAINIIFDLVRKQNYRYNDIRIMVPNIDNYRDVFIKQFRKYDIPLFIDDTESILSSPYIEAIRAAIDVVNYNFSYESVMRYFSSGLITKNTDIYSFSNYLLIHNIRGYNRYVKEYNNYKHLIDGEETKGMAAVFEKYIKPLLNFYKSMIKDGNIDNYINALIEFTKDMKFDGKLYNLEKSIAEEKVTDVESEEKEVLENESTDYASINTLDVKDVKDKKTIAVLNYSRETFKNTIENLKILEKFRKENAPNDVAEKLSVEDFRRILDIGLTSKGLKSIPYMLDAIVVGDLTRTRFDNPKVMLFMGLNQSEIPKVSQDNNLIDDKVRDLFAKNKELSQTTTETLFNQRFYIYLAMTNPTDKLILSWTKVNFDNAPDEKSQVLIELEDIFTINDNTLTNEKKAVSTLQEKKVDTSNFNFYNEKDIVSFVSENLNDIKKLDKKKSNDNYLYEYDDVSLKRIVKAKKLLRYMKKKESLEKQYKNIINTSYIMKDKTINKNLNDDLLKRKDKDFVGSATTIENFNKCHFKFFMEDILKLKDKGQYDVHPYDIGTMAHSVYENLFADTNFLNESEKKQKERIDEEIKKAFMKVDVFNEFDENDGIEYEGANKLKYIKNDITSIIQKSTEVLISLAKSSKAKTESVEEAFEYNISDDDLNKVNVSGKIDRVDVYTIDNKTYVNIVDYKSGINEKKLDIKDIQKGTNIQLTLYIDYCINKRKGNEKTNPIFTGSFYFWIADRFRRNEKKINDTDFKDEKNSLYGYEGLVNKDEIKNVYNDITEENNGKSKAKKFVTKDGYKIGGNLITEKELSTYIDGMHEVVKKSISDIKSGVVTAKPNITNICDYCDYKDLCHKEQIVLNEDEK